MRLKKIKLAGFKSFVDPTTIPFPGEMTAVVGPNGCGKSNVIDAVRWVLGESSAKNLRGDAMTDVIFNGSTARKAVSQCSVELVFDNSSGRIAGEYAGYNELSVKRIVTKEAISSYMLNGSKCRKRDITDLFLGTGLGPRSYAIIEQGMISKLIESRPQELRVFVEEAAGISKYKERRRETENRIKHTKENLERLDDVRSELGEQLSKLKRQAAAATRYKELKASERELKGQLAVARWLKQNELITQAEAEIEKKQTELEEVISRKRGDESNIIAFREQQEALKQSINDIQQVIFKTSTNITKIEQSQLFSKKRKQQIQMELQQLQTQSQQLDELYTETAIELSVVQDELVELEPNKLLMEEALENAQISREEAEEALSEFSEKNRASETQYHAIKQKLQTCHGQIQNTLSMQLRTESRIRELDNEIRELNDNDPKTEAEELQTEFLLVNEALEQAEEDRKFTSTRLYDAQSKVDELNKQLTTSQNELLGLSAQKAALDSIQEQNDHSNKGLGDQAYQRLMDHAVPMSEYLQVETGYESLFEIVLAIYQLPKVISDLSLNELDQSALPERNGQVLVFTRDMSDTKPVNTLASKLQNPLVPELFCQIKLVENINQAFTLRSQLKPGESLISECGLWVSKDTMISGAGTRVDQSLSRVAKIKALTSQIATVEETVGAKQATLMQHQQALAEINELKLAADSLCKDYDEQSFKLSTQLSQLQQQIAQQEMRYQRLYQEKERNQLNAQEEEETLETLNEQVEIHALELAEYEEVMHNTQEQGEKLTAALQQARAHVEQLVSQAHNSALQVQQVKNKYSLLKEKQSSREEQLEEIKEKIELLQEEAEELSMPLEEQQDKLQELLEAKESEQIRQTELQEKLSEIDERLLEAEKGQSGINQAAERIKSEIESTRLQAEGCKVRAQSHLEQLQDMQQALKPILETLPDDIDEKLWQENLERTSASLSRLGAVNLAAVEEFESQSERKNHLDAQNDDLTQALETLETAIRKIDRETRSRFKATFDQINGDLKMLFPKVFGGGSAHLALTDDDMLDTGVTIMAQPPGKKNSTIHLLSGGEKALTALSLVFAIFRLNPAPFCLLDEVDAPLDDANVGRFCKLVSEMSKTVQFIYITHNKVAMEMASHLTGVTMAEPGVSRMVAVDVEEALAIAE